MSENETKQPGRKSSQDLTFAIGAMILVTLVFALWVRSNVDPPAGGGGNDSGAFGLPPGVVAPAITGEGWINGPPPTAEQLAGHVVVVDAWATWCGYCRQEVPMLKALYEKYKTQGVIFVGFTSEESNQLAEIDQYVNGQDIPWPNAYGAVGSMIAYGPQGIPAYWVIGADGVIVWNRDSEGSLEDGIKLALSRGTATQSEVPTEAETSG